MATAKKKVVEKVRLTIANVRGEILEMVGPAGENEYFIRRKAVNGILQELSEFSGPPGPCVCKRINHRERDSLVTIGQTQADFYLSSAQEILDRLVEVNESEEDDEEE